MKMPGFIDSHMHFLGLGYTKSNIDLTQAKSIKEIISLLQNEKKRPILFGRGWNQSELFEQRMLNKDDLNTVSVDMPIIMTRVCGHVLTVNDKMLELAGITNKTSQVQGGSFDYNTGIFSENALQLILNKIPKPSKKELEDYFIKADRILLKNGITSVASDDFCIFDIPFEDIITIINRLYLEEKIHVKITEQVNIPYQELLRFIDNGYVNKDFGTLKMGPLKILADGSLGGKTAYLKKPYENDELNRGICTYSNEELFQLIHLANENEMDCVVHAIGDASVDQVLNAMITSIELTKRYQHNHAIIHAQLATPTQIKLMKKYNIGAIVQPIFLNSDIQIIESRIGSRSKDSYLFKTMYDEGLRVGFSTDSPIEPVNPFLNIYTAVTRKSVKSPLLKAFNTNECFSLEEALACYTLNNIDFIARRKLPIGDYIITNKDIRTLKKEEIKTIIVKETYINNQLVFSDKKH